MGEIIELDDIDGLGAGAVGEPGKRAFYIQARTEHAQLTVLVEKEQVALLATEAVAFLDRIAGDFPETPLSVPDTQTQLHEPTVPLFRARLIGLGYDPERELVLLELRERAADEDDDEDDDGAEDEVDAELSTEGEVEVGYVARIYATRRRFGRWRRAARKPSPADGHRVRCAKCRWILPGTGVPAGTDPRRARRGARRRRARDRRPHAVLVERHVPRGGSRRGHGDVGRLQAAAGRASALGLPAGHARQSRGRGLRVVAALDWGVVPVTILRDGPLGQGAVQRFVEHDPDEHYFTLLGGREDRFRQFAVFDVLANNTDRKGGHCLRDEVNDLIVGIDHGLTFHPAWKLRTVIWDFAGERVPDADADDVCRALAELDNGPLGERLSDLLTGVELESIAYRARGLLEEGFPYPDDGYRSTPWPLV